MKKTPKNILPFLFVSLMLLSSSCTVFRSANSPNQPQARSMLGDREPQISAKDYAKASKKRGIKGKGKVKTAGTVNPYVEAARKEYQKQAKEMRKPQYSNPMYFGHKKKPKKRKRGKRKLCKECGIIH